MKAVLCTGATQTLFNRKTVPASIGAVLNHHGLVTTYLKISQYLNCDISNVSLRESGEVFVLGDGTEVDLSLGIFERVCNVKLSKNSYATLGSIMKDVLLKIQSASGETEFIKMEDAIADCIAELIGRVMDTPVGRTPDTHAIPDVVIVDVGNFATAAESSAQILFTAVSKLLGHEAIIFNVEEGADADRVDWIREKLVQKHGANGVGGRAISLCLPEGHRDGAAVVSLINMQANYCKTEFSAAVSTLADPFNLLNSLEFIASFKSGYFGKEEFGSYENDFGRNCEATRNGPFDIAMCRVSAASTKIGILAEVEQKYVPYLAVEDCLIQAGILLDSAIEVKYIYLSDREVDPSRISALLGDISGLLVPGGFGSQFLQQKLAFIEYARTNNIALLGICLGFQLAIIEFARNVLGIPEATSAEFDPSTPHPVIHKIPSAVCKNTGRNMILGHYPVDYRGAGASIYKRHGQGQRFRHRYALNSQYVEALESMGMELIAITATDRVVGIKLKGHRFFSGVQYHPELGSVHKNVDPIILAFVQAAVVEEKDLDN